MHRMTSLAGTTLLLALPMQPTVAGVSSGEYRLEALVAELEETVPDLLDATLTPGAAIALIEDGAVVWESGFGYADLESKRRVDTGTVFNIGSISKTVAAWGVMKLVEQGVLDLDAPVESYLEGWKLPPSEFDAKGVTVRRLLSHTAGLSLHGYPGFGPDDALPSVVESLNGATNGSGRVELISEPGTAWRYSGGGFTICQLLVEQKTGRSFADYMRGVFPALGLQPAAYDWPQDVRAVTSTCYDQLGRVTPNPRFTAQAAASLKTTAGSLARFGALIFEGPEGEPVGRGFLRPETVEEMLTAQRGSRGNYGLGYSMDLEAPGRRVYGHGGANRGWHATLKLLREERAGLVVLTNGSNGSSVYAQVSNLWLRHRLGIEAQPYGRMPISMPVMSLLRDSGVEEALAFYEVVKLDEPDAYRFGEGELNRVGMALLENGAFDDALLVLEVNNLEYPEGWNTYDGLGYAYMLRGAEGDRELAIENYEEALRRNPTNAEAEHYLARLRGGGEGE